MTTFGFFGNTLSHLLHGIRKYPSIPKIATIAIMMVVFIFDSFQSDNSRYNNFSQVNNSVGLMVKIVQIFFFCVLMIFYQNYCLLWYFMI